MEIKKLETIDDVIKLHEKNELCGFYDISDEIYFDKRCPGLTRSKISNMSISAKYYKIKELEEESTETEALRFGKMFHLAMENWEEFDQKYKEMPPCKEILKNGKEKIYSSGKKFEAFRAQWELESGCIAMTEAEKKRIKVMKYTVSNNGKYKTYFPNPKREITVFATEPRYNMLLKGKVDLVQCLDDGSFIIGDYKSCQPKALMTHHSIQSIICKEDRPAYYQTAYYQYLFRLLGFESHFLFLFIEKDLPFGFRIVGLDEQFNHLGMEKIFDDIENLYHCNKDDEWPCYDTEIEISFPAYLNS